MRSERDRVDENICPLCQEQSFFGQFSETIRGISTRFRGIGLNQGGFRRNSIGINLLSERTQRSERENRTYRSDQHQGPVRPSFLRKSFYQTL